MTIGKATNKNILNRIIQLKGHKFIAGMTQSGKTYLAKEIIKTWRGPVIFFNPQEEEFGELAKAEPSSWIEVIKTILNDAGKVNFIPSSDPVRATWELSALEDVVRSKTWDNLLLVIDECHEVNGQLHYFAKRGLGRGVTSVFISQTPADVNKAVVKQCQHHIIFKINSYDAQYYKNYNLPGQEIEEKTGPAYSYNFVIWDNVELSGPFCI